MSNITHLLDDLGNNVEIELVVNSAGVKLFLRDSSPIQEEVGSLIRQGVRVAICRNSMKHYQLKESTFLDGVEFVASGVGELTRKQTEGWSYIRP